MRDKNDRKLGAFIVPTGVGASIGGFAGDASPYARRFAENFDLIVNPNVVNAGCFSGITENMLYVEGHSVDEFFKENLKLKKSSNNKIGVVFDKSIPQDVLNVHLNTINAVKAVYGVDIIGYELTKNEVGVEFFVDKSGASMGTVKDTDTIVEAAKKLLERGADAIAIVCLFDDEESEDYANGVGVDPVGGVEAIISHVVSKTLKVPCAHSPAFCDYQIYPEIVDGRAASEYITPTFLPCILLGLSQAPLIAEEGLCVDDIDFLIMPYNSLGSIPVFEAVKRKIPVFAVKENKTVLDVTRENLNLENIIVCDSYNECLKQLQNI